MTANEEAEYVCPECGVDIMADAKSCPGCGVVFDSGAEEEETVEAGPSAAEDAAVPEEGVEEVEEVADEAEPSGEETAAPAKEDRAVPSEAAPPQKRRLYGGVFSILGVAFLLLALVAVIGTVALMNWDVWVSGASKETVGPRQGLFIDLGILGIVICMVVTVYDLLRHRK